MANIGTPILGLPIATLLDGSEWLPLVQGGTTKRAQSEQLNFISTIFPAGIDYVVGATGGVFPTGVFGTGLVVPFDCTINQVVLNGSAAAGSVVIDIWKCSESQFDGGLTHPTSADSITGISQPTITVGSKYTDSTLSNWNVTLSQGDVLWYNVISNTTFTSLTIALKVSRAIP